MTKCPNGVKPVAVSRTVSPVTHTAEVIVNSASLQPIGYPAGVARGNINSAVPMPINTTNDSGNNTPGLGRRRARIAFSCQPAFRSSITALTSTARHPTAPSASPVDASAVVS